MNFIKFWTRVKKIKNDVWVYSGYNFPKNVNFFHGMILSKGTGNTLSEYIADKNIIFASYFLFISEIVIYPVVLWMIVKGFESEMLTVSFSFIFFICLLSRCVFLDIYARNKLTKYKQDN